MRAHTRQTFLVSSGSTYRKPHTVPYVPNTFQSTESSLNYTTCESYMGYKRILILVKLFWKVDWQQVCQSHPSQGRTSTQTITITEQLSRPFQVRGSLWTIRPWRRPFLLSPAECVCYRSREGVTFFHFSWVPFSLSLSLSLSPSFCASTPQRGRAQGGWNKRGFRGAEADWEALLVSLRSGESLVKILLHSSQNWSSKQVCQYIIPRKRNCTYGS